MPVRPRPGMAEERTSMRSKELGDANGPLRAHRSKHTEMIWLTRLNHAPFVLNAEQITHLEVTPDTVIFLTDGQKIVVSETAQDVIDRIVDYRRTILHPSPTLQTNA